MAKQTFTTGQVLTSAQMTALQANDYNQTVSAKVASYVLVAADAGTRITMSNAGATTITVNTSLFTAGDTLFITNIGAGASTITAGTATVSTASSLVLAQYDSGRLYFTSTGVAIWEKYQGASGSATVSHVRAISSTTSASTATWTKVSFSTESYDTKSEWASNRFTAASTGYYNVAAGICSSAGAIVLGSQIIVAIYKNGTAFQLGSSYTYPGSVTARGSAFISTGLSLNATDYIEIYFLQSLTGGTLALNNDDGAQNFVSIDRYQD